MTDAPERAHSRWPPEAASPRRVWRPTWAVVVAGVEALLAAAVAVTAVYFLASTVAPMVVEGHPVWAAFFAVPLMLALALVVPVVALAVVFLRWGDRRTFFVASGFAVAATIVGAVAASWLTGCSQGCG